MGVVLAVLIVAALVLERRFGSATGFAGALLLSIVFALAPPEHGSVPMFYAKVVSGCVLFLGLGLGFYWSRRNGGDTSKNSDR